MQTLNSHYDLSKVKPCILGVHTALYPYLLDQLTARKILQYYIKCFLILEGIKHLASESVWLQGLEDVTLIDYVLDMLMTFDMFLGKTLDCKVAAETFEICKLYYSETTAAKNSYLF